MVEIKNLSKRYARVKAINNLNLSVRKGEILGFLGPNGAGKTTTMNIISGYISPTSGSVLVDGLDVTDRPGEVKSKIGYLPERPPLYMDMTVEEQLLFSAELKRVPHSIRRKHIKEIMEIVSVNDVKNRLISNISKGYRQRVGLGQALIGEPSLLILDEPTVGLDPKQIIDIRNLIQSLRGKHTIILSSHILPEVSAVCDRVVIINRGEIAAIDTPQGLSDRFSGLEKLIITVEGQEDIILDIMENLSDIRNIAKHKVGDDSIYSFTIEYSKGIDIRRPLFFALAEKGCPILEMKSANASLEDIFLQLTTQEKEAV